MKIEIRNSEVIKNSENRVQGVFAGERINAGEHITKLEGRGPYTYDEICQYYDAGDIHKDDPLQIGCNAFLLLNEPSRSFNHSCEPNMGIRNQTDLFALKTINPGEELFYDYSITVEPSNCWEMACSCRTKTCRQLIRHILTIQPSKLQYYFQRNALPNFVLQYVEEYK